MNIPNDADGILRALRTSNTDSFHLNSPMVLGLDRASGKGKVDVHINNSVIREDFSDIVHKAGHLANDSGLDIALHFDNCDIGKGATGEFLAKIARVDDYTSKYVPGWEPQPKTPMNYEYLLAPKFDTMKYCESIDTSPSPFSLPSAPPRCTPPSKITPQSPKKATSSEGMSRIQILQNAIAIFIVCFCVLVFVGSVGAVAWSLWEYLAAL